MEAELNVTFITLDAFVQLHKFRFLYFGILFPVYILILCCNFTIVFLVVFRKSLHELLTDLLSERQIVSFSACLFQSFMFYSLGSSEFLLLTVMAFDRYVSICKPLQYPVIMPKKMVSTLLFFSWTIPAFHMSVLKMAVMTSNSKLCSFTLKGIFCVGRLYNLLCGYSLTLAVYPTVILINVVVLPALLIFFSYIRILIISYRSSKEVRRKAAQTCLPHLLVLISASCLVSSDITVNTLVSEFSKTVNFVTSLQIITYQPLFNPIIYGLKMQEIYKHLKKLLCRARGRRPK